MQDLNIQYRLLGYFTCFTVIFLEILIKKKKKKKKKKSSEKKAEKKALKMGS